MYPWRKRIIKFICWFIWYNFNWQNIRIRKSRWKWIFKVESRKEENEYKYENEDEYENEDDDDEYENVDDDETLSQNKIN